MDIPQSVHWAGTLAPVALMATAAAASLLPQRSDAGRWRLFQAFSVGALVLVVLTLVSGAGRAHWGGAFAASTLSLSLAALVQLLGTVIGAFSAQYLQGEPGQRRYVAALAAVLAGVHLLLLADHWLALIAAWAGRCSRCCASTPIAPLPGWPRTRSAWLTAWPTCCCCWPRPWRGAKWAAARCLPCGPMWRSTAWARRCS